MKAYSIRENVSHFSKGSILSTIRFLMNLKAIDIDCAISEMSLNGKSVHIVHLIVKCDQVQAFSVKHYTRKIPCNSEKQIKNVLIMTEALFETMPYT